MKIERQATDELDRLGGLIERIQVGMLTTIGPDGSMRSRPLLTRHMDHQGQLWFFTDADSPKSEEIEAHDHQVCVSYADPGKSSFVSVSGTGRVLRDRDRMLELWTPALETWFPRGMENPTLALLAVRIDKAEFWDSPGSDTLRLGSLMKVFTAGARTTPVENVKTSGPRTAAPGDDG